jgi:hypothetical protein
MLRLLLLAGCLSSVVPDPRAPESSSLGAVLARGEYRGDGFIRVNRAPFASAVHGVINVYVSATDADAYRAIAPESSAPAPSIPPGMQIVREILDGNSVAELTVMEKRDPGFFPGGGDFLFAVTDPDGTPVLTAGGTAEWGALDECGSCHAQRSGQGWLFGVSTSAR